MIPEVQKDEYLELSLQYVAFDHRGNAHQFKTYQGKVRNTGWEPCLVKRDRQGRVVEWYGPLYIKDPDDDRRKSRLLNHIDIVRMTWYASGEEGPSSASLRRNEAAILEVLCYTTAAGRRTQVPFIEDEAGRKYSIYDLSH